MGWHGESHPCGDRVDEVQILPAGGEDRRAAALRCEPREQPPRRALAIGAVADLRAHSVVRARVCPRPGGGSDGGGGGDVAKDKIPAGEVAASEDLAIRP